MTLPRADSQAWLLIAKVTRGASEAANKFMHTRTGQKNLLNTGASKVNCHLLKNNCTMKALLPTLSGMDFSSKTTSTTSGIIITLFIKATACHQCESSYGKMLRLISVGRESFLMMQSLIYEVMSNDRAVTAPSFSTFLMILIGSERGHVTL